MEFGLVFTSTSSVKDKSIFIHSLSDELSSYFSNKEYGSDIKLYVIGILCVEPEHENFFKERKPKYTKGEKTVSPDGIPITYEDSFEYRVKMDFEAFKNANEEECKRMVAKSILDSLVVLDTMRSKIKDFDSGKFKLDLEAFFKEKELI